MFAFALAETSTNEWYALHTRLQSLARNRGAADAEEARAVADRLAHRLHALHLGLDRRGDTGRLPAEVHLHRPEPPRGQGGCRLAQRREAERARQAQADVGGHPVAVAAQRAVEGHAGALCRQVPDGHVQRRGGHVVDAAEPGAAGHQLAV
jgi:hypothetical protein